MARRLCQFLFTLVLLYAAAVGAFAYFHYEGERPDVLTIAGDFHGWVSSKFRSTPGPAPAPGSMPPPKDVNATDGPSSSPAPPPAPPADLPTDERSRAMAEVRDELLPAAKVIIDKMNDPGAKVQILKVDARVVLVKARDLLGALLDQKADDPEVQRLNKRVTDLLIAVDKR